MTQPNINSEMIDRMLRVHSAKGRQWLQRLPLLIEECRQRWQLELDQPFPHQSYNLIIPGRTLTQDEIVLKLGVPCRELTTESFSLRYFAADGAVELLDSDIEAGALLLRRIVPGDLLCDLQDEAEAPVTAAQLMQRLWRDTVDDGAFPTLQSWFQAFERLRSITIADASLASLLEKTRPIVRYLLSNSERNVLLHGDFHHANILFSKTGGWTAIDPKGVVGDPGYEVGSFVLNLIPRDASRQEMCQILDARLNVFATELKMEKLRLARWSLSHAILSALWDLEESGKPVHTVRVAEALHELCD